MAQPPVHLRISGGKELEALAKRLKEAGAKELKRELARNITAETKDLRKAIKQAELDELPKKGGLNKWASRMPTAKTATGQRIGVHLRVSKSGHDMAALNRGVVRHPVFGKWRKGTPTQHIEPGFFDRAVADHEGKLRDAVLEAIRAIGKRI